MAALFHQTRDQPAPARAEQDGAALQLSVSDDLPRRVLGALSLRASAARAPRRRAADGHGARRRVLRAADDDGERAGAGRVAALPAHAGVDGDAGGGNGRGAISAPRRRGASPARARHGPGHADAEAPVRSLRRVHAGGVRLHRARARDCDDGRHGAGGAGTRAVHLPADAHHRRRRRAAREPARLGAASVGILSRAATRSRRCRRASPATGLGAARFSALALVVIGLAGCVAGAKMFRWDSAQRFATAPGKGWVAVALAAWVAVGVTAETQGRRVPRTGSHGSGWHCEYRTGARAVADNPGDPATDRGPSGWCPRRNPSPTQRLRPLARHLRRWRPRPQLHSA